jgi:hypothetical protein
MPFAPNPQVVSYAIAHALLCCRARRRLAAILPTERAELALCAGRAEHQDAPFVLVFVQEVRTRAGSDLVAFTPALKAPEKSSRSSHPGRRYTTLAQANAAGSFVVGRWSLSSRPARVPQREDPQLRA